MTPPIGGGGSLRVAELVISEYLTHWQSRLSQFEGHIHSKGIWWWFNITDDELLPLNLRLNQSVNAWKLVRALLGHKRLWVFFPEWREFSLNLVNLANHWSINSGQFKFHWFRAGNIAPMSWWLCREFATQKVASSNNCFNYNYPINYNTEYGVKMLYCPLSPWHI